VQPSPPSPRTHRSPDARPLHPCLPFGGSIFLSIRLPIQLSTLLYGLGKSIYLSRSLSIYLSAIDLVPLSRANRSHCELLVSNLGASRVSVRELERIYMAWRLGDSERRRRIVTQPLLFLKATEEPTEDKVTDTQKLLRLLEQITDRCFRARRLLHEGEIRRRYRRLDSAWAQAEQAFIGLKEQIQEGVDAGSGHTHGDSTFKESRTRNEGHCTSGGGEP